jgi:hypothetical protein
MVNEDRIEVIKAKFKEANTKRELKDLPLRFSPKTVHLDIELHEEVKKYGKEHNYTIEEIVEKGIRMFMNRKENLEKVEKKVTHLRGSKEMVYDESFFY